MDLELLNTISANILLIRKVNIPITEPTLYCGCCVFKVKEYNQVTRRSVLPIIVPFTLVVGPPPVNRNMTLKLLILPVNVVIS